MHYYTSNSSLYNLLLRLQEWSLISHLIPTLSPSACFYYTLEFSFQNANLIIPLMHESHQCLPFVLRIKNNIPHIGGQSKYHLCLPSLPEAPLMSKPTGDEQPSRYIAAQSHKLAAHMTNVACRLFELPVEYFLCIELSKHLQPRRPHVKLQISSFA